MQRKKKRFIAILLVAVLIISLSGQVLASTKKDPTPNMDLLNAILYGDRSWVADTLVRDNRSTNPTAYLLGETGKSMAQHALDTYYGIDVESETYQAIYRGLIGLMDKYYNFGGYVGDLAEDFAKIYTDTQEMLHPWVAAIFTNPLQMKLQTEDILTSTQELRYDRLLKAIYTEPYTASDGTTINDNEKDLMWVRQLKDAAGFMKNFSGLVQQGGNAIVGTADREELDLAYIKNYAVPYADALDTYLNTLQDLSTNENDLSTQIEIFSSLATIAKFYNMQPEAYVGDFSYLQCLGEYMVDNDIDDLFKGANKSFSIAETSLDSYLAINNIQEQRETILGPIDRLAEYASDNQDMYNALTYFSEVASEEYNNSLFSYDRIVNYLRDNDIATELEMKAIKKLIESTGKLSGDTVAGAAIGKISLIVSIATGIADRAVGLKETCLKTYELIYWNRLMIEAVGLYYKDVDSYKDNPTEENAEIVLDDLLMLQRFRLYGEKIAYGIASAQTDNWVGELFGPDFTEDTWRQEYQESVDILIAASVTPPLTDLTVASGDMLTVFYDPAIGYHGRLSRSNGKSAWVPELSARIACGITNNGTLLINGGDLSVGYLETGSGSVLHIPDNSTLTTASATINGTTQGGCLAVTGALGGRGNAGWVELIGKSEHKVYDSLNVGTFRMVDGPVNMIGNLTVTGTLYGPDAEITDPQNMLLSGGTVVGGSYPELLRVQNARLADIKFENQLKDLGGTTYSGIVTVDGGFSGQGTSNLAESALLDCQSDAIFTNMTLNGTGQIDLHGDVSFSETTTETPLNFCGAFPQQVSGTATVRDITFANRNKNGVTLDGKITVKGVLDVAKENLHNTENLYLTEQSSVAADDFLGDLSFENWSGDKPLTVTGNANIVKDTAMQNVTLHVTGDCSGGENATYTDCDILIDGKMSSMGTANLQNSSFDAKFIQCSSMTLENSHISADQLRATGTHLVDGGSTLSVSGGAAFTGTLTTDGETKIKGDCSLTDTTVSGGQPLIISGDLAASGTTKVHHLILDGALGQTVSGKFTADILELKNTAPGGVTVTDDITVLEEYRNKNTVVTGEPHIVSSGVEQLPGTRLEWSNVMLDKDTHVLGDLYLVGDLTLNGAKLTVDGDIFWTAGNLTLTDSSLDVDGEMQFNGGNLTASGSEILVEGSLQWSKGDLTLTASELTSNRLMRKDASTSTLTIDAESTFYSEGAAQLQYLTVKLDGLLLLGSDAVTTSAPITGSGTLRFRGDLQADSPITLAGGLEVIGKLPQTISGSGAIHVENVTLDNPYKTGVTLTNDLYYSGALETGETVITGAEKLIKEDA